MTRAAEFGYTFESEFWGHGYASEAIRCVSNYVRTSRAIDNVVSLIHPENVRLLKLAAKFNLDLQGQVECFGWQALQYAWDSN